MKNKYQRMNKEEKKKCREKFYATEKGKGLRIRFIRLTILGIIGICFATFLVVSGYISGEISWATWVLAGILLFFSLVYLISPFILKAKVFNDYAVKHMK